MSHACRRYFRALLGLSLVAALVGCGRTNLLGDYQNDATINPGGNGGTGGGGTGGGGTGGGGTGGGGTGGGGTGGGGTGQNSTCATIEGDANLFGLPDGEIAVTANSADLAIGPYVSEILAGEGAFSICVPHGYGSTALLGIHDTDGNWLFEPSDERGEAGTNPFSLGGADVAGVQIDIPGQSGSTPFPTPPPYIDVTGLVSYAGYAGGDVLVAASVGGPSGIQYYTLTLAAPGPFALRAPANTSNVIIWAVSDEDANGLYTLSTDAWDATAPIVTGSNALNGVQLDLLDPLDNSISGQVFWTGAVDAADTLHVALHDNPQGNGNPVEGFGVPGPTFPVSYLFDDLAPGTYWVSAFLDIGSDSNGVVGATEPWALYVAPVTLSGGSHPTGVSFAIVGP